MLSRLQTSLLSCLLALAVTARAEAQEESTVDNDVACATACNTVNWLDEANNSSSIVQSTTQSRVDQAREYVNDACSNTCQKPEDSWSEE